MYSIPCLLPPAALKDQSGWIYWFVKAERKHSEGSGINPPPGDGDGDGGGAVGGCKVLRLPVLTNAVSEHWEVMLQTHAAGV